ncbi:MAG TPA: hypothetical protein VLW44_12725 [Streptosporangiaceae bacterium]|nr:hypothetical protein [Streptosporangiaceae bacterium]
MNRRRSISRLPASCAALLAATGLALAGCSSGSSSSSASPAGGSATAGSSSSGSFAGTPLFPVEVGNTWVYQVTTVGIPGGTATDKVTAVVPVAGGNQVTTTHEFHGTTVKETLLFGSSGSISMPLPSLGSSTFKIESGGIVWPSHAQIMSGQPYHSTVKAAVTIAGQVHNVSTHVTVQGAGSATVTVPAGTYHTTLINDTLTESFMGASISLRIQTWLASGVGPVKSEVTTNGTTISTEELKTFTKG